MTGDIVGSANLKMTNENWVVNVIQSSAVNVSSCFQNPIHYEIDIFREDSWQIDITKTEIYLRIGFLLHATPQSTPVVILPPALATDRPAHPAIFLNPFSIDSKEQHSLKVERKRFDSKTTCQNWKSLPIQIHGYYRPVKTLQQMPIPS